MGHPAPTHAGAGTLVGQEFREDVHAIVSEDDTGQILSAWIAEEELLTLATTIDTRWPEMNAFIATGITNARTEGYNRLVKQVKRAAANSQHRNSARRIRFHCTGNQQAATQTSSLPGQNRR
jgi:hypothetical protein